VPLFQVVVIGMSIRDSNPSLNKKGLPGGYINYIDKLTTQKLLNYLLLGPDALSLVITNQPKNLKPSFLLLRTD